MSTCVVLGAQWGDEGKGRFVDFLAQKADAVVRYQGGNNAGHTIECDGKTYKLHLVPAGVLYDHKPCVIGHGVVINPGALLEEIDALRAQGLAVKNLHISDRAHIVMPYHILLDGLQEDATNSRIGTTRRGIGPCYTDKAERSGLRICDLYESNFKEVLASYLAQKNRVLMDVYGMQGLKLQDVYEEFSRYAEAMRPFVCDSVTLIHEYLQNGDNVLFEGAQGTMLDLDVGTYPYVTSSHPISGGVCVGAGIGPTQLNSVLGVAKAYTTRVGEGPFITELLDDTGAAIREKGHEYGATTGRPRRCGWLDLVVLRHAVRVNGITALAISRMDTLGGFDTVQVCTGYDIAGDVVDAFPASLRKLALSKPIYKAFKGWDDQISHVRDYADLPENARTYLEFIESFCGVPVSMVGVGPNREECVVRSAMF